MPAMMAGKLIGKEKATEFDDVLVKTLLDSNSLPEMVAHNFWNPAKEFDRPMYSFYLHGSYENGCI